MSRYETLNVSLQTDNRNDSRLSQTVDYENDKDEQDESDQRVKKFRDLYYRNQKLRKQLKLLNTKLNERLEKVKFPSVKKRAVSVDLNHNPPTKAMQRELQNAYKQVKMYRNQIEILKIKQQTPQNYAKLRDVQNMIAFRDQQIAQVQQQLKSIKSIKKMQERTIVSELENEEVKQRLNLYQTEHKQLRERLKDIARKARKRQLEYKKQQAYLVALQKKARFINEEERKEGEDHAHEKEQEPPQREITQAEFTAIKTQIAVQKKANDQVLKKIEVQKKNIAHLKQECGKNNQRCKQKQVLIKNLQHKITSLLRLIKEEQKNKEPPKNKLITKIEELDSQADEQGQFNLGEDTLTASKEDQSLKRMLNEMEQREKQREWKGKYRKLEHGFGAPADKKFQFQGEIAGFKISLDENQAICGLICVIEGPSGRYESQLQGLRSNVELNWVLSQGDYLTKITGSFTEQSYLNQLVVVSRQGQTAVFGAASVDSFVFRFEPTQRITGCFGSVRQLGSDKKITELGFWLQRKQ